MPLAWLVEDSLGQLDAFEDLLTDMGYQVISFSDGEELLRKLNELPSPEVIVMDLALAGTRNGFQIAEQILKMRRDVPSERFCFITGWKRQFLPFIPDEFRNNGMIDKQDWTVAQVKAVLEHALTTGGTSNVKK